MDRLKLFQIRYLYLRLVIKIQSRDSSVNLSFSIKICFRGSKRRSLPYPMACKRDLALKMYEWWNEVKYGLTKLV